MGEKVFKSYLNVGVSPAAAIEFQHFKDKILEKINSYFGYKAIIDLRIQQNYIPINKNKLSNVDSKKMSDNDKINILKKVENMENNELKNSLFNLGKNIIKENNNE